MIDPQEIQEIKNAVKESTEEAITTTLLKMGVDVGNPLEMQKDLAFARKQRLASEQVSQLTKRIIITTILVSSLGVFWIGFKDALKH